MSRSTQPPTPGSHLSQRTPYLPPNPPAVDLAESDPGYSLSDLEEGRSELVDQEDYMESIAEDLRGDDAYRTAQASASQQNRARKDQWKRDVTGSLYRIGNLVGEIMVEIVERDERRRQREDKKRKKKKKAKTLSDVSSVSESVEKTEVFDSEVEEELMRGQYRTLLREQQAASIPPPEPRIRMPVPAQPIPEIYIDQYVTPIATPTIPEIPYYQPRARRRALSRDPTSSPTLSYTTVTPSIRGNPLRDEEGPSRRSVRRS